MQQPSSSLRIISMVPSWTEMLFALNIKPVGRTRFCIEPKPDVSLIATVGGTKNWDLSLVQSLTPNLLILDKDENPKFMSEGHTIPFVATHVHDIKSCIDGIQQMASAITQLCPDHASAFADLIYRWQKIENTQNKVFSFELDTDILPGLIQWVRKPTHSIKSIHYLIWKNPWMEVTKDTFIGDVARKSGLELTATSTENRYPQIDLTTLDPESTLLLFSSEPYPFHKKIDEIADLPFPSAIVNGQNFSWFGTHSLKFLETLF